MSILLSFATSLLGWFATILIGFVTAYWVYDKFTANPLKSRLRSYEVEGEPKPGEGKPRRAIGFKDLLSKPNKDVSTLFDLLNYAAEKYANNKCLGHRDLVKIHSEEKEVVKIEGGVEKKEKKTWQFFEMSPYKWITFSEFAKQAKNVGYALASPEIGMKPKGFLGIYSATQPEWQIMAHAAWSQNLVVVTSYANLGEEGLVHCLNQGEIGHLFTNFDLLPMIKKVKPQCSHLKVIIYSGTAKSDILSALEQQGLKLFTVEEILKIGAAVSEKKTNPPLPEDLSVIMYTSGTTDLPKGVMITHANMVAAIAGAIKTYELHSTDIYIAYLPLAHVLELSIEQVMLMVGASLGYANNRTLTDASVRQCKGDIRELAPTLMAGVPVVWERIRKGALTKIEGGSSFTKTVFHYAYQTKLKAVKEGRKTPILDAIVFNNFKKQVGGRLRLMVSGGAPLSAPTHEFLRVAFSCPVLQGYGLTEVCGLGASLPEDHLGTEKVGAPLPSCQIKLVDVPQMGYTSKDKPHPRGEIWFGGNIVSLGYFKLEEKTKEDFHDGWFATGDIGEWNDDGTLAIIDRKKNLVKLSHGEYIAVEKLESKYHNSQFVENVLIYADGMKDFPVAVVRPNEANLIKWAKENGISDSFENLCERKEVKAAILASLQKIAKDSNFKEIEVVKNVFVAHDEWTPENGLLTAAMKLKRQDIVPKYRKQIDALY